MTCDRDGVKCTVRGHVWGSHTLRAGVSGVGPRSGVRCETGLDRCIQSDIAQRKNKILIHGLNQNFTTIMPDAPVEYLRQVCINIQQLFLIIQR